MGAKMFSGTEHRRVRNQHMGIRLRGDSGSESRLRYTIGLVAQDMPGQLASSQPMAW